ncbi:olfactory receptor 51G2-like [Porphyrio hochstetteri]
MKMLHYENNSSFLRPTFLLTGIPGMQSGNMWLAIPFCSMYVVSILGNSAILFTITAEHSLHEPSTSSCALWLPQSLVCLCPTVLSVLLSSSREIRFDTCLTQMFFIHCFSNLDFGVLLAVAFNCFMAICKPLQHSPIFTNPGQVSSGWGSQECQLLADALPKKLSFCRSHVLAHSFCWHPNVPQMPPADTRVSSIYGLVAVLATSGIALLSIILS